MCIIDRFKHVLNLFLQSYPIIKRVLQPIDNSLAIKKCNQSYKFLYLMRFFIYR